MGFISASKQLITYNILWHLFYFINITILLKILFIKKSNIKETPQKKTN